MNDELPYMPVFVRDLLAEMAAMDPEERGVYVTLLLHLWLEGGRLKGDPPRLARIAGIEKDRLVAIWDVIGNRFSMSKGGEHISHPTVTEQLTKSRKAHEDRQRGAELTNAKRAAQRDAQRDAQRAPSATQSGSPSETPSGTPSVRPASEQPLSGSQSGTPSDSPSATQSGSHPSPSPSLSPSPESKGKPTPKGGSGGGDGDSDDGFPQSVALLRSDGNRWRQLVEMLCPGRGRTSNAFQKHAAVEEHLRSQAGVAVS